jgi:endoglycosylceramidase
VGRRFFSRCVAAVAMLVMTVAAVVTLPAAGPASAVENGLPSLRSPAFAGASVRGAPAIRGPVRSPGGPYLYDSAGRVVFLHGVDAVYKRAPFELYPAPGKPWNFSAADASLMARMGFDVVRLGMTWSGLEPGKAKANDPAICDPGKTTNPHQLNVALLDRYLARLKKTVELLGRFHIFTVLDMHQDVYNETFDGEGAPAWAVCTNGVPSTDPPGRWSREYSTTAADIAFRHFWTNDVRGNLQGQYDHVWGSVAQAFRGNPWVIGYDPFNEPFSTSLVRYGDEHFAAQLQCFYTGTKYVRTHLTSAPTLHCPRTDPASGVVPTILANDPSHLIFDEPDNYGTPGYPTFLAPMRMRNLVYNVHLYCGARSPVTGNPTNVALCAHQVAHSLGVRKTDRPEMASQTQPDGPAWLVTEFGATSSVPYLETVTATMDAAQVGWIYWSWKYYGDPTGSSAESLVRSDGRLRPTARALSQAYPQAVAGRPISFDYSPGTDVFHLAYAPNHRIHAPTVIFVPTDLHYPRGYCARVTGGRVTSVEGSDLLDITNGRTGKRVAVTVEPGACRPESARRSRP